MKKFLSIVTLLLVLVLLATAFVGCKKDDEEVPGNALQSARDYIYAMYKDKAENTPSDYQVVGVVTIDGATYTVTWSVNVAEDLVRVVPDADGKLVTIDVVDEAAADVPYTLTATIADAAGNTETVSFTHKVPKFVIMTWAEYIAAAKGDTVVVEGIATGIISKSAGASKNGIYFQDNDGGYYAFDMKDDPATLGVEIGMKIRVTGTKDIYSGTHEIASPVVTILDSTKNPVTPADYTEIFANATALTDEALVAKQSFLVTIRDVLVTGEDESKGYYWFQLGDLETYVRISGSACPLSTAEQATFKADHAAKFGYLADVTGVISVFEDKFYLTPVTVGAYTYKGLPEKTPAEKVAFELDNAALDMIVKPTEITLPTAGATYTDVAFSWALAANDYATYDATTGKLTVTTVPSTEATITLTLTATCGADASDTKEVTVTLYANSFVSKALDAAGALDSGNSTTNEWIVVGVVTDFEYNTTNSNATFYLSDGVNKIMVYRAAWEGLADVQNGDVLAVKGQLKKYNTTLEVVNASVYENLTSIADALAAGVAGTGVKGTVVYGQIISIDTEYSTEFNNITVTISDGTNSLYCYRLAGGEELKVGDFILVTGKPSAYNGKGQMAQGATYVLNGEIVPAEDTGKTFVSQALDAAGALDSGNSTTNEWIVVGAVTGYTYDSAKTKQQFSLSDGVKQILVYGANWEGIADLQNGTILAVKGILKNYNGTLEVMNPEIYANLTSIADAAAAGIAGTGAEGTVIYGKITSIDTAYSASFDNITVTISDGTNSIQCYRLKGGADLEVGDCILVTGTPSAYNGDAQMGAGATYVVNGEIVPPDEDTRDTYDAATNNTVTYNFSETVTKASTTAYTVEQASTVFEESCNLQKVPLEVSTVTVVYPGNGTATGFIKLGKSGAGGTITLKFDRAVASVQIKCHDYYTSSDTNPENFTTLAVNGSDGQVVPYTADGTPDVLTFNLSESSKEVTISSGKNAGTNYRVFIYEIVIVFA